MANVQSATRSARVALARLAQAPRAAYQVIALILLIAVVGEGVALIVAHQRPDAAANTLPALPSVALPAHSDLSRIEFFPDGHGELWYYTISGTTVDAMSPFYAAQARQHGWRCYTTAKYISNMRDGQPITGVGLQIMFRQGTTQFTVVSGDQEYGSITLGDTLDSGEIVLRITEEPTSKTAC